MGWAAAAAGIGAVGSIAGSAMSAGAASDAANTQAAAADRASQNAMKQYMQTREDLGPYRDMGRGAVNILSNILGLPNASAAAPSSPAVSSSTPVLNNQSGTPGNPTFMVDPLTGQTANVAVPDGQRLQFIGFSNGGENAGDMSDGHWALTDANGNPVRDFPKGFDLQTVGELLGGIPQSTASTAAAPAPATPTPGNALQAYGLPGLTFNPQDYGLKGPIFNPTEEELQQTPGYQFTLQQGLNAVANSNAAKGLGVSGAAMKGAASYATGLADNTLQTQAGIFYKNLANAQNIFQTNLGNVMNPLEWAANLGQNSAATTGQQGIAAVGNANNALIGGANAQAAGTVGSANALASGLGGLGNSAMNYLLLNNSLNGSGGGSGGGGGYIDNGQWSVG